MHKYIRVRAAAWMPSAGRRTVHVKRVRNTLLQRQLRITLLQGSCAGNARTVHVKRVRNTLLQRQLRITLLQGSCAGNVRTVNVNKVRITLLQRQLRITLLQGSCAGNARTVHVRRVHAPTLPPGLHLSREAPPSLYLVHHDGLARPAHGRVDGATASRRRVNGREVGDDAVPAAG